MNPIKTLGLAAITALMAMAFLGASSAVAEPTALCGADESPCAEPVTHIHRTIKKKTKIVFGAVATTQCEVLELISTTSNLANPLIAEGNLTYSNCDKGCTVSEENGPAEFKLLKEGHETASLTFEFLIHATCTGINCRFNGVGLKATAKGPLLASNENGEVLLTEQTLNKESGLFCPATTKLTFEMIPSSALYISS